MSGGKQNLNTSHVKVKRYLLDNEDIVIANLNTSHVKVKQIKTQNKR